MKNYVTKTWLWEAQINALKSELEVQAAENRKLRAALDEAQQAFALESYNAEKLRAALEKLIRACYEGRIVQRGVGGMTIEAQTRNSVINGVWAWAVCEAEEVLNSAALSGDKHE